MSAPTAPTTTTICTEALRRFLNGATPTAADVARADAYGMEKVKRDIMNIGKTWKPLIITSYDVTRMGVARYANPADFEQDNSVGLMTGAHAGAISAVADESNVTLAVSTDISQNEAEGKLLLITAKDGTSQAQEIARYNITTKACVMAAPYETLPEASDGYLIVTNITDLHRMPQWAYDQVMYPGRTGTPVRYAQLPDEFTGRLALHPTPNTIFGLRRKYYADLMKLDTDSDLYSTILRRWAGVLEQGIFVWKLTEDDDRYAEQNGIYQGMLMALMGHDLDGFDPSKVQQQ